MNHPFKIKICGVTSAEDATMVAASEADAIGLNFYPQGKRYVDMAKCQTINSALADRGSALIKVGVFVNANADHIIDVAEAVLLDAVQLHGDESPEFLRQLVQATEHRGMKLDFIRAIRTVPSSSSTPMNLAEIETEINRWVAGGADAILIDAAVTGDFGGTGKQVDWVGFSKLNSPVPKILAGGLTPENVAEAIQTSVAYGVDVASGVESAPGKKDTQKTNLFCESAKNTYETDSRPAK